MTKYKINICKQVTCKSLSLKEQENDTPIGWMYKTYSGAQTYYFIDLLLYVQIVRILNIFEFRFFLSKSKTFCSFQFGIEPHHIYCIPYMQEEQWFPLNIPAFLWFQQFSAYWHDSRHTLASSKTQQTSGLVNIKVNLWKSLFSFSSCRH